MCAGDFNEILWSHEKCGLGPKSEAQMMAFRDVLDELGLKDLGFVGRKFTWKGRRHGGFVLERLDRAVANALWQSKFPGSKVQHLHSNTSDHQAILVKPEGILPNPKRSFKFEQMWLRDKSCSFTVNRAWGPPIGGATMPEVAEKVNFCAFKLIEWSKNSFGSVKKMLEEKKNLLAKAELATARGGDSMVVKSIQKEINDILDKENLMWQQRSQALFLNCGDRNTAYFHSKASQRFRRNRILGLRNSQNTWCTDESQIKDIAVEYFQSLFSTSSPSEFSAILERIQPSISETMNEKLLREFSQEEVETAINQMKAISAPGPDGMPPLFYQSFWNTINEDVCSAVLDCLNNCRIPKEINHTHIALIPKVKSPERMSEFRLISLCSVIYKLVSKVLANRLKCILPSIVSENQSAFQAGRVIIDNILMAFETLHYMKYHQSGKSGFMALKLDMSKAYDRVEWLFL